MAAIWNIDPAHTLTQFSVRHMMVSNVKGRFVKTSGTVLLDDGDFTQAKIEVAIDAASLDTREPQRDTHLRSADFLEVAKYPVITFRSTRITPRGDEGQFTVTGDLTIHGTTRPITLNVDVPSPVIKDPYGNMRRGFEASGELSRKDFGLTWNQALEAGGAVVGDKVKIGIEVELTQQAQAAAEFVQNDA